ncbi:hypothetical protein GWZ74_04495 [Vibrio cholerae]|nr:hypothetical protein [Vibrio cholerae]EGQ7645677.1 hypothetical protein [Vibrio cholerae]EGQ8204552.1 hypothetical protein [Vibrio cholerae]EIF5161017.1 hypothetical protein [Vibrio cholerae]EKF9742308.1 hypothetical protein [Vibrio cholerae]EKF9746191.1 hypothetical protein [Vibrio cholerae]
MSNNQNPSQQERRIAVNDKGLPPASSGSRMPQVKPVAQQQTQSPAKKS